MARITVNQALVDELNNKKLREDFKISRNEQINNIKVTVDSMVFDGNENSQTRMTNAIACLENTETIEWILADNTKAQVTKDQLQQALKLSVLALSEIWTKEITNE